MHQVAGSMDELINEFGIRPSQRRGFREEGFV